MPHNLLTHLLKTAFEKAVENDAVSKALLQQKHESRRKFLKQASTVAAGSILLPSILTANNFSSKKNVVIVGAGMAGLNAAYQLKKLGISSTVYEASARPCGRMFTMKDYFGKDLTTDIGGEFVDTSHEDILGLLKEFNLEYYDLREDKMEAQAYYFEGKLFSEADLATALKPFIPQLVKDLAFLPAELNYKNAAAIEKLDNISITEYMASIGISGWLYKFINVMITREYGMEASEQPAINFLVMLDKDATNTSDAIFGSGHEVFKIKGGSQHLANALYKKVEEKVILKHRLNSIKQLPGNRYQLAFSNSSKTILTTADLVILALPYSVLRSIKMDVTMPAEKRKCINEWGYGNGCKFAIGFNEKPWTQKNRQGYTFTDEAFGCGWDSSHMQSEKTGSFTVFGGGDFSDTIFSKSQRQLSWEFVPALEKIYEGSAKAFNGKQLKFCWAKQPFAKGSYTALRRGQYSTLAGWEAEPVGNIFFAGEHVSSEFQGYMNGAAETGRKAAMAVAEKILLK